MKLTFLMPRNFRFVGIFFIVLGLILGISRFYFGNKPDMLDMKMFAFSSSFLDTRYMEFVRNNLSEELTGFFLIAGLFLFAFSREKEENEQKNKLRLKAFYITAYLNFLFLLVSLFFTFGFAFIYMLIANMGISLLLYLVVFRTLLIQNRSLLSDQ
jgi:uncharacterized membrane protein YfcA